MRSSRLASAYILALFVSGCSDVPDDRAFNIELDDKSFDWIGTQVFRNECAGREACLVHWNAGEAFPSLGIGHFIWYPEGVKGPFVESFPAMIQYLTAQGVTPPDWLVDLDPFDAPWPDREAWLQTSDTERLRKLRDFLSRTRGQQAGFLVQRAKEALGRVAAAAPKSDQNRVSERIGALIRTPGGTYALIDYVNFKGEGLAVTERYEGQGWGLLQVLQTMSPGEGDSALQAFREAAARVLTRRAENADKEIERERWLSGWLNRLETYREPE